MSVIVPSATVLATVGQQSWGQRNFDTVEESDVTGAVAVNTGAPPRWTSSIASMRGLKLLEAGEWEALVLKLRGRSNHIALHDLLRPAPLGTLRGTPLLGAAVAAGATTAQVDNAIGTLERGDWLQLATGMGTSQLVKIVEPVASAVTSPATFTWDNGGTFVWTNTGTFVWDRPGASITITFEPPARIGIPAFSTVTWDKPVAYFKVTNTARTWRAVPNGPAVEGFDLDLVEEWNA